MSVADLKVSGFRFQAGLNRKTRDPEPETRHPKPGTEPESFA